MAEFRHETERLVLRDWRGDADWAEFFRVTNTPAVMEWLGGVLDDAGRARQRERVEGCAARNGFCFWALERKADGALLGFCGLKRADAPGSTVTGEFEIGWRLREDAWGKGYAKEAAKAALEAAFERFGADEVVALTVDDNAASWGLMIRLGMRRREDLDYSDARYDPPWRDTVVYSIDRAAWEQARG
ncbi:GNAT family N-acetyltransferase [Qipengyuania sp. 6B39]|uniref:GNAT family N-acetyltransferase n=1 Tax=Qipengyuania proteolytica TaxID=2867239 RepID=UPI001C88FE40|nr:GNAT family N-acetyltransferase [Qipengyuania proteolytica]MBX7494597.1 GNAT family N-acetyltransferase [Qipengyuania proteolytica]